MQVHKILNRLDIDVVMEMRHALAQHFVVLLRAAAADVDVDRPGLKISERVERINNMRTIKPPPPKLLGAPDSE
jgi:hypothetical protein